MLLVSFPNTGSLAEDLWSLGRSPLALLDLQQGHVAWLRLPDAACTATGITGLADAAEHVYALGQSSEGCLVVTYEKPRLHAAQVTLLPLTDVHDALVWENQLYVVSTGTTISIVSQSKTAVWMKPRENWYGRFLAVGTKEIGTT